MRRGFVFLPAAIAVLALTVSGCPGGDGNGGPVIETTVEVTPLGDLVVLQGATVRFAAQVLPEDRPQDVLWTVQPASAGTISRTGELELSYGAFGLVTAVARAIDGSDATGQGQVTVGVAPGNLVITNIFGNTYNGMTMVLRLLERVGFVGGQEEIAVTSVEMETFPGGSHASFRILADNALEGIQPEEGGHYFVELLIFTRDTQGNVVPQNHYRGDIREIITLEGMTVPLSSLT